MIDGHVAVLTVVGARPQFIKASAVSRCFAAAGIREVLVHTGQHYDDDMSDVFFRELDLRPADHNLGVHGGHHSEMTGLMMERLHPKIDRERPDVVLVYGDTNSTLAGALAGAKAGVPVVHVEAGLRSFNRAMPEELNRVVADHVSTLLCCPTATAVANLHREGFECGERDGGRWVANVGDVMLDVLLHYRARAEQASDVVERLGLRSGAYAVLTIHRAENTQSIERLRLLLDPVARLSRELPVVFVVHPRTAALMQSAGEHDRLARERGLVLAPPLGYLDFLRLQAHAHVILTDSGGIQKEAFFLGVPCVTLRDETEWPETVAAGGNRLAGTQPADLREALEASRPSSSDLHAFGDGCAAERVVALLQRRFHWMHR